MTTPAGWYPDPYDDSQLRYWDGSTWTGSTTPAAGVAPTEVAADSAPTEVAPYSADLGTPSATDPGATQVYDQPGAEGDDTEVIEGFPPGLGSPPSDGGFSPPGAGGTPQASPPGASGGGFGPPQAPGQGPAGGLAYGGPGDTPAYAPPGYGAAPAGAAPGHASGSGLGDIGDWLSSTFSVLFSRIVPVALFLYAVPVLGAIVFAVLGRSFLAGLQIDRSGAEVTVDGYSAAPVLGMAAVAAVTAILSAICWLAAANSLYSGHLGRPQSIGSSLGRGLRRFPRAVLWGIVAALLFIVGYVLFILAVTAVVALGDGNSGFFLLLVPLVLVVAVLVIWLAVRLSFWGTALAVGPSGTNPFSTSWRLTRSRFWPLLGRILLLALALFVVQFAINVVLQLVFGAALSNLFQVDATTGDLLVNGQPIENQDVISFADFTPGAGWFVALIAVYTLGTAINQAVSLSGTAGLYTRAGGPGDA